MMKTKKTTPEKVGVKKQIISKPKTIIKTKVNHIIPKVLGMEMIARFEKNIKNLSKVKFEMGKEFDKTLFEELLKLKGIKSVRIYNALNADNTHTFVITGLDKNSYELYFQIKRGVEKKQNFEGKDGADTTLTYDDGVGNMGNQCTEPPTFDTSAYFQKL